ncbi:MAG: deoxyribose-phosphate aldolase [Erysipelotrichaceae bacterium]
MDKMTLAKMIDQTFLKPFATHEDMKRLCSDARKYGFGMVAINSVQCSLCKELLKGSDVHVGAAIGFPLGQTTIESKVFETLDAIKNGADEIDYVINLTECIAGNDAYIKDEMTQMVEACHQHHVIVKVIFENCYLNKSEIIRLCEIAKQVKPDFIKTSTGFGTGSATLRDVILMKQCVGDEVKIKAAGGIRCLKDALKFIEAGASRIGTSNGIEIVEELK